MESIFTIVLLILMLLFYLSNPKNNVNKWCVISCFLFWLGVAKEAVLYNIIPIIADTPGDVLLMQERFMPVNNVLTWALYALTMPTVNIFALGFCDLDTKRPKLMRRLKALIYLPALALLFFFSPLHFKEYQLNSAPFWYTYAVYNFAYGFAFVLLMIGGFRMEPPGRLRRQKLRVALLIVPPVVFWMTSVFLTHPFGFTGSWLKLWRLNALLVLGSVIVAGVMAFHDGFMGMKLSRDTYKWNSNMQIINTSAEYTGHMLKNQTSKMEMCIERLQARYGESPEELSILIRSIDTLKNYMEKIKRHSQDVVLIEEPCRVTELLTDALPGAMVKNPAVVVQNRIDDTLYWICDKSHMTEVFTNILINAAEAIRGTGTIEITGEETPADYLLHFRDSGEGMDGDRLEQIFTPYFTTKNTEQNFGLGLAYCKNVVNKHGANITGKSIPGKGTTISIAFPIKKVEQRSRAVWAAK